MKVLAVSGSPRKGGNTDILLGEALAGVVEMGAAVESLAVRDMNITQCDGCESCRRTGRCHIDDEMEMAYTKLLGADGIIFGTPVFLWSMTGQLKTFLERMSAIQLTNKVGGVITVARRTAAMSTASQFYLLFSMMHMLAADWVIGYAGEKGAIRKDKHAMKAARHLGRQVVLLAQKGFQYPEEYPLPLYRYVTKEYGIPSCPTDSEDMPGFRSSGNQMNSK